MRVGAIRLLDYQFRHAEPRLFLEKARRFRRDADSGNRIDLSQNFRSRPEVLHGINDLFEQLMDEEVAEIEYDDAAMLVPGRAVDEREVVPEIVFVDAEKSSYSNTELESRAIATRILELVAGDDPFKVIDEKTNQLRACEYRDIVILVRSKRERVEQLMDVLTQYNIPAYADSDGGYFQATEIRVMLSLLKVIDNPLQDIPLVGVLRSPLFSFTDEELAQIRLESEESFYEALGMKANDDDVLGHRCHAFLDNLSTYRTYARNHSLSELIQYLFNETGYYDFAGGLPGGKARQENLKALYDRCLGYERGGYRGLYRFLRIMDRLQDSGEDLSEARSLGEDENVVRIMTIHKSKGLEFPVTIVSQLGKQFNKRDQTGRVIFHKRYGISLDSIDVVARTRQETFVKEMIKRALDASMKAEEMRVLYVALTRAREKVILFGTMKDRTLLEKWADVPRENGRISAESRRDAKTYLDWVAPPLLQLEGAASFLAEHGVETIPTVPHRTRWTYRLMEEADFAPVLALEEMMSQLRHVERFEAIETGAEDEAVIRRIQEAFTFAYPHLDATHTGAKQSVTELKRAMRYEDADYEDRYEALDVPYREPRWKHSLLTGAERGTVLHLMFQLYEEGQTVIEQIEKWTTQGFLNEFEKETALRAAGEVEDFFASSQGKSLLEAIAQGRAWRELPFSYVVPAERIRPDGRYEDEHVVVQGVIDCLFHNGTEYVLLDYKSDQVKKLTTSDEAAREELRRRYAVQLGLYKEAIEAIWDISIGKTMIYSIDLRETILL